MAHIQEHCALPTLLFKREGRMHICDCGRVYRVAWEESWYERLKHWQEVEWVNGKLQQV